MSNYAEEAMFDKNSSDNTERRDEHFFTCIMCGSHSLEEVMLNCTVSTDVVGLGISRNSHNLDLDLDYGDCTHADPSEIFYQCGECGNRVGIDEVVAIARGTQL